MYIELESYEMPKVIVIKMIILTSLKAPIRGKTLVSFLMRAINSLLTGELKYTNALQHREITKGKVQPKKEFEETKR